jgi:hypothetical protein
MLKSFEIRQGPLSAQNNQVGNSSSNSGIDNGNTSIPGNAQPNPTNFNTSASSPVTAAPRRYLDIHKVKNKKM